MSRYGFDSCSCGSSMLKPTESPPPSRAPRFAASMTPGPPPVTIANPASASRVDPEHEQRGEPEVRDRGDEAPTRSNRVVRLRTGVVARLPSLQELNRGG